MTRPRHRIDRILYLIRTIWEANPDLRLSQMLIHATKDGIARFSYEDYDLEPALRKMADLHPLQELALEAAEPDEAPVHVDAVRTAMSVKDVDMSHVVGELRAGRSMASAARTALYALKGGDMAMARKILGKELSVNPIWGTEV